MLFRSAAYAKLAGPALLKYGARYLARDVAAQAYEAGIKARIVIVEFDSVAQAVAAHDSPDYQAALKVFDNAAERDFLYSLLRQGKITDESRRRLERELDLEEATILSKRESEIPL